ncbi:MAG: LynF/TruF/PatF family peptide O-prenyltransferase [Desmonostoc vinosum HA7617-LM4]|jgi:LynF/TruF/PatF family peptide O-prenyltransferase|nr:LynF/TruF/PatF family peptide O-prenyltransferase [Desmonostoc vinosum HA7617-LM4]
MVTFNTIQNNSERYLEYIGKHKRAFDIYEDLYPLKLFEDFVQVQGKQGGLFRCACNVDRDSLSPARFALMFPLQEELQLLYNPQQHLQVAFNFFRQVESRAEVKLGYHLIQKFFSTHSDFRGIFGIGVGVDAQTNIGDSRLKLFIWLKNSPEKVETAIALCGEQTKMRAFLVNDILLVGFDLFLDGRSEIELYPTITRDELQRVDIRSRIISLLPPCALPLLDQCEMLQVGISAANESNILYFSDVLDPNSFIDNLGNEMAKKVHAYYRHQPVRHLLVGVPEKDFYAPAIEKVKLYYFMK